MKNLQILWVDDEIDLLKLQVMFLTQKGHQITTAADGYDAVDLVRKQSFDMIFLDENMPGMSGFETLAKIKQLQPTIPVVMITKSEEENIMDQAIGSQIADYLIKPVNPNQILLSIKKILENKELITKTTTSAYQTEFTKLSLKINNSRNYSDWVEIYKELIFWELELRKSKENTMDEVFQLQKVEANSAFAKFIKTNYLRWFSKKSEERPLMLPDIIKQKIFPLLDQNQKVVLIVVDNLRYDQWKMMQPILSEMFQIEEERLIMSILPTATQYARNALFAGLMPLEISKIYPQLWLNDEEEGMKNLYEEELLKLQFSRSYRQVKYHFEKIMNNKSGKKVVENLSTILPNSLIVLVYNFVDILSHSRTEMDMIRELAQDEAAYRDLTMTWFEHSSLRELFKELSTQNVKIILTTDHGTIKVQNPIKVVGDRNTTTNLRYKQGKNLNYNPKEVFEITQPEKAHLPLTNVSSTYIFATNHDFFAYPNNYNHYVKYYKNTFQHGGVSMEELLIPFIILGSK